MGFLDPSARFWPVLHFDLIQSILCNSCKSFIILNVYFLSHVGDPGQE